MEQTLQNIICNTQSSHLDQFFQPFQKINCKEISHYVKTLKKDSLSMHDSHHVKKMSALSLSIIKFMSEQNSYKSQLYCQALTTLNNALNIKNQFLGTICIKSNFYKNLQFYFSKVNVEEQISAQEIKIKNFNIYSVLYLVVMIIYKNNSKEEKQIIMTNLFTKKFISEFLSLQIPKVHKIQKIIGTIILFISKNVCIKTWGNKIKQFLLQNLNLAEEQNNQFYFFYSFRQIKQLLEISEIRKYSFIEFCISCLKNHISNQSYAFYIYQTIISILKRYHLLGYSFIRHGLMQQLQKGIKIHENYILIIFQMISVCLPFSLKQKAINYHLQKLFTCKQFQKQVSFSLKILRIFFKQLSESQLISLIEFNFIQKLTELYKFVDENSDKKIILNLIYLYLSQIKKMNGCIFKYIWEGSKIKDFLIQREQRLINKNKQISQRILSLDNNENDQMQIE